MLFPIIYKRASSGKIQQWQMELEGTTFDYRTIHGSKEGKLTTTKWTKVSSKNVGKSNVTSLEEQAKSEIEAKYTKQLETGYFESEENVDDGGYFKPMLAKNYDDLKESLFEKPQYIFCQPKLDGIRCVITKEGMFSRNGKKFETCPHIFRAVSMIFEAFPDLVLDGELYTDKYKNNFNEIVSLVKKIKPSIEDINEAKDKIQFWIYDLANGPVKDMNFSDRMDFLTSHGNLISCWSVKLTEKTAFNYIERVDTESVPNQAVLDYHYRNYLESGYEGQIIRLDTPYANKRSTSLLKRKTFMDDEFVIKGVEEGEGNRTGTVGWMDFVNKNGKEFKSNVKGSHKYLAGLWDRHKTVYDLIGKTATIRFFDYTPGGIPRFPYVIAIDRQAYE